MSSKYDNPLGMGFILPEHRQALHQHKEDKRLIPQPVLEEDELMELNFRIMDSRQYDYAVTVCWWYPVKEVLGEIRQMWGWVQRVDTTYKQLKLVNDEDFLWIDMDKIVQIRID